MERLQTLKEKIAAYNPNADFSLLEKAYLFTKEAHEGQLRKSGEPYFVHPVEVALILAEMELDIPSIIAGLMHDVIEDTEYSFDYLKTYYGEEVAELVEGVTKLGQIPYYSKEEEQAENLRKMFLAMAKDIRVILIKLADRLHNMRTLKYMSEAKQKEKAQETLDIYAPLAHRLGISKIKWEMEDLALRYIKPDDYYDLVEKIAKKRGERVQFIETIVEEVRSRLEELGMKAHLDGRPKHFFSIYRKIVNQDKTLDQIYDLFAIRVIVGTVKECYEVLGVVHELYKPVPGRFKDYIAMPKPNMYQSLHNTLIGPEGEPFEIQIRTWEMHRIAEYGIAAHWKYKESQAGGHSQLTALSTYEEKLTWLRQILEWQKDLNDNTEFMNAIKIDLNVFDEEVYVFTPKGDVTNLKKGATPIDFAYHIHSAVGNKMVGARVNGKIVPIDYKLKNGDRVEIITSQNSRGPSRDWLKIVVTSQARNKINQWFKKQFKDENIIKGKEMLEKEAKKLGYSLSELTKPEWMDIVLKKYGFKDWDALCAGIGHGGIKEKQVLTRLIDEKNAKEKPEVPTLPVEPLKITTDKIKKNRRSGIVVQGLEDMFVRFSKCCNPVPGDEIIGFITKGRGISIHRTDCTNVIHASEEERQRFIEAEWEEGTTSGAYLADLQIFAVDRNGLLGDVSTVFTDMKIPIRALTAKSGKYNNAEILITIEVNDTEQLKKAIKKARTVSGVTEVQRGQG